MHNHIIPAVHILQRCSALTAKVQQVWTQVKMQIVWTQVKSYHLIALHAYMAGEGLLYFSHTVQVNFSANYMHSSQMLSPDS